MGACPRAIARALLAAAFTLPGLPGAQAQGRAAETGAGWSTTVRAGAGGAPSAGRAAGERIATSVDLRGDAARTRIAFELTAGAPFTVFRMANPFRVIVDLEDVTFRLPTGSGQQGQGLITAFRYGLFAPGKARIVMDTTGPVRVAAAGMSPQAKGGPARLEIELVPTTASELAAAEIAAAAQSVEIKPAESGPPARPPSTRVRPVIIIDPGHGGIDPGAQGALGLEKDLVLAVSREIRRSLMLGRKYEVIMTRSSDVFLSLDQRVRLSRRHQADLFLSVHADSLAQRELAQNVRGATVYTLAEMATDDRAMALAEKENASDLLAGVEASVDTGDEQVRNILFDLMRRETANHSADFRTSLVQQLRPHLTLARDPMRSAPFKVLRQPGSPAVLIELGYLSNAEDEKLMSSQPWQRGVGEAVAKAVDAYFRRRSARSDR